MRIAFLILLLGSIFGIRPSNAIDFDHDIVPILRQHCLKCHGGDEAKGGFSINSRELFLESEAAVPGDRGESLFLSLVDSDDPEAQMPPKELPRLSDKEKQALADWINADMPWTGGFSFDNSSYRPPLLPRDVQLPGPAGANPIDQILGSGNIQADDATFFRRASLDLNGLLPSPERLQAFISDGATDKRARLIDELLANRMEYTEHWLTFFNDLFRNDYDGTGFITGGRKQISNWLYAALMENKPFDDMTRELVSPTSDESRGFIDGIKWRGTVSAGQTNEIQFAQSVAQSFLGINLKCASCHDSFIDRWKLTEAYSLAAVYANEPLLIHRCDKPTGETAEAGWLFPELGEIDKAAPRDERLKQLADLVTHRDNGRYARTIVNRLWAQLMGRGIVHPLDAMHTRPWNEDLLDYLGNYLVQQEYDIKAVLRLIATSQAYGSPSEVLKVDPAIETEYVFAGHRAKRMTAEQFLDSVWQLTGAAPTKIDAPVTRGIVAEATAEPFDSHAKWIWGDSASEGAIPPAGEQVVLRKTINIEQEIAAGSAVVTADNEFELYINGKEQASGNDWNQLQAVSLYEHLVPGDNKIVAIARNAGVDPNPAGFFFAGRVKLADDSVIEISSDDSWQFTNEAPAEANKGELGKINDQWKTVTVLGNADVYARIDAEAKNALFAATNSTMVRAGLLKADFLMRSLGRPNRDQIVTSRPSELTTLEAIDLANGGTFASALSKGASRLAKMDVTTGDLIHYLFRFALSREPSKSELATLSETLGEQPDQQMIEDVLWAICMMPEFMMVR